MKYNLKNRPKWEEKNYYWSKKQIKEYNEWFEGFEAELRELLKKAVFEEKDLIEELLGD